MQLDFRAHAHKDLSAMHPAAETGEFEVLLEAFDAVLAEQTHQREHLWLPPVNPLIWRSSPVYSRCSATCRCSDKDRKPCWKSQVFLTPSPSTATCWRSLDPQGEHGLRDPMMRSLLEAAGQTELEKLLRDAPVAISRKEPTEERKRSDIVLFTSTPVASKTRSTQKSTIPLKTKRHSGSEAGTFKPTVGETWTGELHFRLNQDNIDT
jgi:hypothetical protein